MSDRHGKNGDMDKPRYVTLAEVAEMLEKVPTRWEVRFLILFGLIGAQLLPVRDVAHAAILLLP